MGDDTAYAISWNGDLGTATKNAIYDKIEAVIAGAAANAFKTINAPAGTDPVADGVADTLNITATGDITITGNSGTDTIDFSVTNTVAGDLNHNDLANLNAGDNYEHITQAQKNALHSDVIVSVANVEAVSINNLVEDTIPQLGGDLDTNQKSIEFDPTPTNDDTGQGIIITATIDQNTQGFGNAMHLDTDGHWIDAHADNATTAMPCMALALEAGTGTKKLLLRGIIRDDDWNWTVGAAIYVSDTASGDLTETQTADTGEIVQFVGWALSADVIFFNPSNLWLEMK